MRAHEFIDEGRFLDTIKNATVAGGIVAAADNAAIEVSKGADTPAPIEYRVDIPLSDPIEEPEQSTKETRSPAQKEERLLALTMWGEARAHGERGMRAVGHVVMNRKRSERNFGDTITEVVWKRKAFSCWNKGDPNREAMRSIARLSKGSPDYRRWQQAKQIAKEITAGESRDPTGGSLFYHTTEVQPGWSKGLKPHREVANHVFFRNDRKANSKES